MAAKDIADFYPEWVKKHPLLEKYETLSEINKKIPVEDYRESADLDFNKLMLSDDTLENKVLSVLEDVNSLLIKFKRRLLDMKRDPAFSENVKKIDNFIVACNGIRSGLNIAKTVQALNTTDKLSEAIVLNKDVITDGFDKITPKGVFKIQLKYNSGINLTSICRMLMSDYKKHLDLDPDSSFEALKDISTLDPYKELSYYVSRFRADQKAKSQQKFEIVFSKQPSDLLSMSIRSDWTSCQNLCKDKTRQNVKAIYSSTSPYVGIIYLTNKNQYRDRGEEMVARSLIFYLENDEEGRPPLLYVGKVYSNYDKVYIKNIFLESLKKHTDLKVEGSELIQYTGYHFPFDKKSEESFFEEEFRFQKPSGETKEFKQKMPVLPYFDTQEDRSKYIFPIGMRGKTYFPGEEFDEEEPENNPE